MSSTGNTNNPGGDPPKPGPNNGAAAKDSTTNNKAENRKPQGISSHKPSNQLADIPSKLPQSAQKNETNLTIVSEENNRILSETENNNRTDELEFSNAGIRPQQPPENQLLPTGADTEAKPQPQQYLSSIMQQLKRVIQNDNM